ncbi:intradiol ring-cleavage dioxygenase [Granulicella sibirica]|uniref:Putative dioxygenase n=1 Tax=Granulicella sibirica TaxID=2479048 RepID=A0A4Q0SXW9_9BACT|nr:intradiol ring-cleavage dioxygenase [Granulicella sibirica]RXH55252.1 putative dioxygenase [Granulicella sibirica]
MPQLTRRRFLATTAAALPLSRFAFAGFSYDAVPCVLTPEQEVGPFYVADELIRPAIHEGRPGTPLHLHLKFLDTRTCKPIPSAAIDLWHCDASGIYSGYTKASQHMGPPEGGPGGRPPGPPPDRMPGDPDHGPGGPGGPPPAMQPTDKLTFCRGLQMTAADGTARFETIVPGFYEGRTNHIHMKVRFGGHPADDTYKAGHTAHVGQIFFPEDLLLPVMATEPYSSHKIHRTTAAEDGIFQSQGGRTTVAHLINTNPIPNVPWIAEITIMVDPTATPKPVGGFGGPGGPGHPPPGL